MTIERYANSPQDTLNGAITSGATTLTLNDASEFPSAGEFRIRIGNELMLVTGVSGNDFTVTRNIESTTAAAHSDGDTVTGVLTRQGLLNNPLALTTGGDLPYLGADLKPGRLAVGTTTQVLSVSGSLPAWVAPETPFGTKTANTVFAGPSSGGAAAPAFRALVAADIPDLSATYQPLDADLTAIAALGSTGFAVRTAANTWAQRTITAGTGITVNNGNGVSANPEIVCTITQYTDELAQDAVGGILTNTTTINLTYSDATPSITADVNANSISNTLLRDSGALSVIGRSANSSGDPADISAVAASDSVLRESGSTIGFGTIATAGIANNAVTDAKIRDSGALSVIGRAANSSGDPADISATAATDAVLRESGSTIGFGTIATAGIANNAVTDAKIRDSGALSVIGRSANSSGDPADISATATSAAVLRESGSTIGFGTVATAGIADNAITDGKLRDSAALSVIGRSANSSGDPADIAAGSDHQVLRRSGTALGFGAVNLAQSAAVTGTLGVGNGGTGTATTFTTGSVVFAGASGVYTQDNTNFFWDDTNNRLGLGTTPSYPFHLVKSNLLSGPGASVEITQTQVNTSDTNDSAFSITWVLSASSASSELVVRAFSFTLSNGLTGGGAITALRAFNLSMNFNASTTTSDASLIYIEVGDASGTADIVRGCIVVTLHGTNRIGYCSIMTGGTNRVHFLVNSDGSAPTGTFVCYFDNTDPSYFAGDVGIGDTAPDAPLDVVENDAVTNAVSTVVIVGHHSSGTPAAGFGAQLRFQLESASAVERNAGAIDAVWVVATDASRTSRLNLYASDNGGDRIGLTIESDGTNANLSLMQAAGSFGSGSKVVFVPNAGTNPSANPTAGGILYSNAGAGTWRGSGGTVTAFGPAGPHCGRCGYDFWTVASRNDEWGAYLYICGMCGKEYRKGPHSVMDRLSVTQLSELIFD